MDGGEGLDGKLLPRFGCLLLLEGGELAFPGGVFEGREDGGVLAGFDVGEGEGVSRFVEFSELDGHFSIKNIGSLVPHVIIKLIQKHQRKILPQSQKYYPFSTSNPPSAYFKPE